MSEYAIFKKFWPRFDKPHSHQVPVTTPEPFNPLKEMRSILKDAELLKIRMDKAGMNPSSKRMISVLHCLVEEIKLRVVKEREAA
jgi:hypothetical protein